MHALEKTETSALGINVKTAVNTSRANDRRIPLIRSQTEFSRTTVDLYFAVRTNSLTRGTLRVSYASVAMTQ